MSELYNTLDILKKIEETKVISIIRKIETDNILAAVGSLHLGGIRSIEITMDSPNALKSIERVKNAFVGKMLIGAGTVLDKETAREVILAGADFILSPTLSTGVIEMCNRYSKLAVPGVFTPTEALTAWQAGAGLVKVFPVSSVGPGYIKDLLGPLSQLRLLPVGGVGIDNADSFIKAGAFAVGIGGALVSEKDVKQKKFKEIEERSKAVIKKVKEAQIK